MTDYLYQSFSHAVHLLISADAATYAAIGTTLKVSTLSMLFSLSIGVPLGFLLGHYKFYGKKIIKIILNVLLATPTVVIGLLVYAFISSKGLFGYLNLLFSVSAIVIGQTMLALPIVVALVSNAIEEVDQQLKLTLLTLGANSVQLAQTIIYEARYVVFIAIVIAYSRVFSELGISMMLGGNIKWYTRTIATTIALETNKGEFALGIALGIILLLISLITNLLIMFCREKFTVN